MTDATQRLLAALEEAGIKVGKVRGHVIEIPRLGFDGFFIDCGHGDELIRLVIGQSVHTAHFSLVSNVVASVRDYLEKNPGWSPEWPTAVGWHWLLEGPSHRPIAVELTGPDHGWLHGPGRMIAKPRTLNCGCLFLPITLPPLPPIPGETK